METEFWAVWEAIERYLSPETPEAFREAVTGGLARRRGVALTHTDITAWLIPGLMALGVEARLIPLDEKTEQAVSVHPDAALPVFSFSTPIETPSYTEDRDPETVWEDILEPAMTDQALWSGTEGESIRWHRRQDREQTEGWESFRARFSHGISLWKAGRKGLRRDTIQASCLRWTAYAAAYPRSMLTDAEADATVRLLAAEFLRKVAGKQRDRISNRLRWAADAYERSDVGQGLHYLRVAVIEALTLPVAIQNALLSDPKVTGLSDPERRELIYLARAGTRDLKILAARRLAGEIHYPDAQNTLNQLRYDSDPWVRAVVIADRSG